MDSTDDKNTTIGQGLAERLAEARQHVGLSQADLAAAAGVSGQQVYRLERGEGSGARLDTVAALAGVLQVSPSWLAYGEPCAAPRRIKLRRLALPRPAQAPILMVRGDTRGRRGEGHFPA